ncbi:MAG: hypothetical protein QXK90_01195, partial [Candidatus Parvarchaeota archaeon]
MTEEFEEFRDPLLKIKGVTGCCQEVRGGAMGEREMRRTLTLRLLPDRGSENRLKLLCSLSAKLWNEVNYARRRMFFEEKRVDLKTSYREFYERYKVLIGSATAQQILNKNDEA